MIKTLEQLRRQIEDVRGHHNLLKASYPHMTTTTVIERVPLHIMQEYAEAKKIHRPVLVTDKLYSMIVEPAIHLQSL